MVQEELVSHGKIGSIVTHQTVSMARIENAGDRLCQVVFADGVDDVWDVDKFEAAGLLPIFDGKVLDTDMTRNKWQDG